MSQDQLIAAIQAEVDAFAGNAGVFARNLITGEEVAFDADTVRPTASTFKVPVMIELFRQAEAGTASLDEILTTGPANYTKGSGVLQSLTPGVKLSARDVAMLMIIVSDNQATNMLLDYLGIDNINASLAKGGFEKTRIYNRIDFEIIGNRGANLAVTTPRELATIMEGIARKTVLSEASCDGMLEILGQQHYRERIPRYMPFDQFLDESNENYNGLKVYNKTGSLSGMRGDVAYVEWPGTKYVIALISEGDPERNIPAENPGALLLARLSKLVFDYFGGDQLKPFPPLEYVW